jgi:hypothetical protein
VVNRRIRSGGKHSDWTWWKTVGLGVVETVGLDVVVNSRIGRGI